MENITDVLQRQAAAVLAQQFQAQVAPQQLVVQPTAPQHQGQFTVVLFPLFKAVKADSTALTTALQQGLLALPQVAHAEVTKGFLNLTLTPAFWLGFLDHAQKNPEALLQQHWGQARVMVEFASPNTNKPLHLGHLRNLCLGDSLSRILSAVGYTVVKANLLNDRGIHICKSMYAWQHYGNGEQPGPPPALKGDHLVGKYYVAFERRMKDQAAELLAQGVPDEEARNRTPLMQAVQHLLRQWEAGEPETLQLWRTMNTWVYEGFQTTLTRLGITFDQLYYESDTYLLGKQVVEEGLQKGVFYRKPDGSVWCDLTDQGLEHKLVLRADGTSVYVTQDLGTADMKAQQHRLDRSVYVVAHEQDYHFQVLFAILGKLGRSYAPGLYHLSYGLVELPSGRMKTREGTVVDADDLMDEVVARAAEETAQRGKTDLLSPEEQAALHETLGLGALKYYLLRVTPSKKMLFDPQESVSLQGDTGPFVQYSHARICSLLAKAASMGLRPEVTASSESVTELHPTEAALMARLYRYPATLREAAETYNPTLLTLYLNDLAKDFNRFYTEVPILKDAPGAAAAYRLALCSVTATVLQAALGLLGIQAPERM